MRGNFYEVVGRVKFPRFSKGGNTTGSRRNVLECRREHEARQTRIHRPVVAIRWHPMIAPLEELIAEAEEIEGLKFVRLERVLEWKKRRAPTNIIRNARRVRVGWTAA